MSERVLFLEDDDTIRDVLREYMLTSGFAVSDTPSGRRAIELLKKQEFKLAVLDIMTEDVSGYEVLDFIRGNDLKMGVIMLTALGDEASQIRAFNSFADDYVIKPVSPIILIKRMETIMRRLKFSDENLSSKDDKSVDNKGITINKDSYTAYYDGKILPLTLSEYLLLEALYSEKSRVFTREVLILKIYNEDYIGNDRIIDAHIKNLRKKLPVNAIKTVVGLGYRWNTEE